MPTPQANPWGSTGAYGYTANAVGQKKLNPYYIPKYTQGEGTPTLDEKGRYYWDYGDPNMEASDLSKMQDDGNGELTGTTGYVTINGKKYLRVGDMWEGDPSAPKPKLSFDSYGPLTYDEKYGWIADAANVKAAPRPDSWADRLGPLMPLAAFAAIAGPALAAGTTFSQAGAAGAGAGGLGSAIPAGIGDAGLSAETIASLGAVDPATTAVALPGSAATGAGAAGATSLTDALTGGAGAGAGSEEQLLEAIRQLGAGPAADPAALQSLQSELLANSQFIDPGAWDAMAAASPGGDFSGAFDTGGWSGSGIFGDDSIWNSIKRFGTNALDKIPGIASALKAAGAGQQRSIPGQLSLNPTGSGMGGGGGSSGAPRGGNAGQFEQNPFAKLPAKVQAKTLADYLRG